MAPRHNQPSESGSHWRRWNPHIHAPGTLLNDQFDGDWDGYLRAIESARPTVEVIGVTDYLCLETYKAVTAHKKAGRLPDVTLLFPNVEFRMASAVKRASLTRQLNGQEPYHVQEIMEQALVAWLASHGYQ